MTGYPPGRSPVIVSAHPSPSRLTATVIVVGAPGEDVNSIKDAGAVSVLSLVRSCPGGADLYATLIKTAVVCPAAPVPAASSARLSPSGPTSPAATLSALPARASAAMVAQAL